MFFKNRWFRALSPVVLLLVNVSSLAGDELVITLAEAERRALQQDVRVPQLQETARALEDRAVAQAQWPDPKLKLGAMNFPVDSFNRDQEAMTQLQVGIQQAVPAAGTLVHRAGQTQALIQRQRAAAEAQHREVLRDVRLAYLDWHYRIGVSEFLQQSRELFRQLVQTARAHYASGRGNQQDVLRAQLEQSLLEDRHRDAGAGVAQALAALQRLIGELPANARPDLEVTALQAPPLHDLLRADLQEHPMVRMADHKVSAGEQGVQLARDRYRPGWMLDLTYGERTGRNPNGERRADFLSAMVMLDLPLFTANRQDRELSASLKDVQAARYQREDRLLELQGMLDGEYALWQSLGERLQEFDAHVLSQAHQNARAALRAYQSGVTDFTALMRARLTELETRIRYLSLQVERGKSQARLVYLAGETT